jgi:hypothetical protein
MTADAYFDLLQRGPFPGQIDPWAEDDFYFHQIHDAILGSVMSRITRPLLENDFIASLEPSLQLSDDRNLNDWNEPELMAIYTWESKKQSPLSIIELISPRTKDNPALLAEYKKKREYIRDKQETYTIEIDLTRSINRAVQSNITSLFPYYTAIFRLDFIDTVLTGDFLEPLRRFALPLRNLVIPVELQAAYDEAYHQIAIAPQIQSHRHYAARYLHMPSLLTEQQKQDTLAAVEAWHSELNTFKPGA